MRKTEAGQLWSSFGDPYYAKEGNPPVLGTSKDLVGRGTSEES